MCLVLFQKSGNLKKFKKHHFLKYLNKKYHFNTAKELTPTEKFLQFQRVTKINIFEVIKD